MTDKVNKLFEMKNLVEKGITINVIINVIIVFVLIVGIYLMFSYDRPNRKHVIGMTIVTVISVYYALLVLSLSFGFSYLGYKLEEKTDEIRDTLELGYRLGEKTGKIRNTLDSNTSRLFNVFGNYTSSKNSSS